MALRWPGSSCVTRDFELPSLAWPNCSRRHLSYVCCYRIGIYHFAHPANHPRETAQGSVDVVFKILPSHFRRRDWYFAMQQSGYAFPGLYVVMAKVRLFSSEHEQRLWATMPSLPGDYAA